MIRDVNTLSITGTCLLAAFCVLNTACNDAEKERLYTEKTLEANAKLKQEISRLKQDMSEADDSAPDKLEQIVTRYETELKAVSDEEAAVLKENIGLAEELDRCKAQRAALNAASAELKSVFDKELDLARKAKSKLSRDNEYHNR